MRPSDRYGKWLRFAVLHHTDWPGEKDHYDLALEAEPGDNSESEVLMKFVSDKFPKGKEFWADLRRMIRRRYLTYEGTMSGNRGRIKRLDSGIYCQADYETVIFNGSKLKGTYVLDSEPCVTYRNIQNAILWMKTPAVKGEPVLI